jgi:iron complex transport system substrate-binding protein
MARALRRLFCAAAVALATAGAAGAPPQRIVSLLPSLTESVCALGACARRSASTAIRTGPNR